MDNDKIYNALDSLVVNARFARRIARQATCAGNKMLIERIETIKEIVDEIVKETKPQSPGTGTGDSSHGDRRGGVGEKE